MEEKIHRGEFLKKKMQEARVGPDELCLRMNIGRSTLWRWIKSPDLPIDKFKNALAFLGYEYDDLSNSDTKKDQTESELKEKLYKLQEKYVGVFEELAEYKAKYGELPGLKRD